MPEYWNNHVNKGRLRDGGGLDVFKKVNINRNEYKVIYIHGASPCIKLVKVAVKNL